MNFSLKPLIKPLAISLASQFGPQARRTNQEKLWVLMYHRILPMDDARFKQEEPGMVVTPESFSMHLQEAKRHFDVMFLSDWIKAKSKGDPLPKKACAITFDDGWLDNFEYALPLLKAEAVPATLFAVAEKIGTDFQFWPNIISILLLNNAGTRLSEHPTFHRFSPELKAADAHSPRDTIAHIIHQLKQLSDETIFDALRDIQWRNYCPPEIPSALMSWEQLRAMQDSGLVEVGSHTCSHRRLNSNLGAADIHHEIVTSKQILEEKLHKPVNLFCFPNGDYNSDALALVEATYEAAVTTRRGINHSKSMKIHEITRIGMHNEISDTKRQFCARLSGWT